MVEGSPPADHGVLRSHLDESGPFKVYSAPPSERTRHAATHYLLMKRIATAEYSCRESGLLDALVKQERAEIGGKKGKPRVVREGWGEFRVGENSVTFERLHFMTFYWRGRFDLSEEGALLSAFFAAATARVRKHAM